MERFENVLKEKLDTLLVGSHPLISDAVRYAVLSGGKRLRPKLVYEFCRICGGKFENADSAAAAIEFIQCYSLIHDDLPCMDDDELRRGKPSCHAVYGEAVALLAGDSLGSLSAESITSDNFLSDTQKIKIIEIMNRLSGIRGMIGGQILDMIYGQENNPYIDTPGLGEAPKPSLSDIERMYCLKTGALLSAACQIGCICADAGISQQTLEYADSFAQKLGLAYQIEDDILDVEGDESVLGKPLHSDEDNGKLTYLRFASIDEAKSRSEQLTAEAIAILQNFPDNERLVDITKRLLSRTK
ncbi:MAG: polyprenyl synthetase family protein [Ruminococcus sp.]|jgi:geranylgeranyl diphosphate synthase type II|nr:polyprenyl synthetase family protein [Ruminococcus sp.]